jgi:hypothetical protein
MRGRRRTALPPTCRVAWLPAIGGAAGQRVLHEGRHQRMGRHQPDHRAVSTGPRNDGFATIVAELLIAIQCQPGRVLELVGLWLRPAVPDQARRADQRNLVDGASGDRATQLNRSHGPEGPMTPTKPWPPNTCPRTRIRRSTTGCLMSNQLSKKGKGCLRPGWRRHGRDYPHRRVAGSATAKEITAREVHLADAPSAISAVARSRASCNQLAYARRGHKGPWGQRKRNGAIPQRRSGHSLQP